MDPLKCHHEGCTNTHKSATGYCHEHAEDVTKHRVHVPKKLRETGVNRSERPHLFEEKIEE